jgi:hypothetical protein
MMKKLIGIALLLTLIVAASPVHAQKSGSGFGLMIGDWSGVATKFWLGQSTALQFGFGAEVGLTNANDENEGTRIRLLGDYLLVNHDAIESTEEFPIHYGVGAYANLGGGLEDEFGVRAVIGLSYIVQQAPLDLYLDLVPHVQIDPSIGFGIGATMGVRYYP